MVTCLNHKADHLAVLWVETVTVKVTRKITFTRIRKAAR